jgi:hypothetical protein
MANRVHIELLSGGGSFDGDITYELDGTITSFTDLSGASILYTGQTGTFISNTFNNVYVTSIGTVDTTASQYYNIISNTQMQPDTSPFIINIATTISDPPCFNEGTKIWCLKYGVDEYIPIEQLRKGDIVKTYKYGYRKIDLIGKNYLWNNPDNFRHCMYKMVKTDSNNLIDDLIVTGGHSILVDDLGKCKEYNQQLFHGTPMIENKYLLLASASNEFVQITDSNKYTYYHLILENNEDDDERFGIWANGVLTETPSKKYFIQSYFTLL